MGKRFRDDDAVAFEEPDSIPASATPRYLGDVSADSEEHLPELFVECSELKLILNDKSNIIYGSKGAGKTTLRRALCELHGDRYYHHYVINLKDLAFSPVYSALDVLRGAGKLEIPTLARSTWLNVLAMYCIESVSEAVRGREGHTVLQREVGEFFIRRGLQQREPSSRILRQIEIFFDRIAELAGAPGIPDVLTEPQLRVLRDLHSDSELAYLLRKSSELVSESGKRIVVCLDGFDTIVDHTPDSRRAIFAGLIDAILTLSTDDAVKRSFCFKAFLPYEIANDAHALVWDIDKYPDFITNVRWDTVEFERFVCKRLQPFARSKSGDFNAIWNEVMPSHVPNASHGGSEKSFEYILRHTLHRPRQVLWQLQVIFNKWDDRHSRRRIDPSFVPQCVSETNKKLSQYAIAQLSHKHPEIREFMRSWHGSPCTMRAADFCGRLRKIFAVTTDDEENELFNDLYDLGVFGIYTGETTSTGGIRSRFRFSFVGHGEAEAPYAAITDNIPLAIAPMFREYCECTNSEMGIVIPVGG